MTTLNGIECNGYDAQAATENMRNQLDGKKVVADGETFTLKNVSASFLQSDSVRGPHYMNTKTLFAVLDENPLVRFDVNRFLGGFCKMFGVQYFDDPFHGKTNFVSVAEINGHTATRLTD